MYSWLSNIADIVEMPDEDTPVRDLQRASRVDIGPEELDDLLHQALHPFTTGGVPTLAAAQLRDALATNPSCPDEMHEQLTVLVHRVSAEHLRAPQELLSYLALSPSAVVRRAVAGNESTSPSVLRGLCADEDGSVRLAAIANNSAPTEGLEMALEIGLDSDAGEEELDQLLESLADHPNANSSILEALVALADTEQAALAAGNPNLDTDVIGRIMSAPSFHPSVRLAAMTNPNNPYFLALLNNLAEEALGIYTQLVRSGVHPMSAASIITIDVAEGPERP